MRPNFDYEKKYWRRGYKLIGGMDEVGRGSFAGPVVTAAVAFAPNSNQLSKLIIINDSKQMRPKQREIAEKWIKENVLAWGIGQASVSQINKLGIRKATEIAFRKAIKNCGRIDFLLVDAFCVPYVRGLGSKNQLAIIKGDSKSVSISAASIVAKVYRDRLVTKLSKNPKYKKYSWDENKGYGTLKHRKAILKYGVTKQHRKKFVESWQNNSKVRIQNSKLQVKI